MHLRRAIPLLAAMQLLPAALAADPIPPFGFGQVFITPAGSPFLSAVNTGSLRGGTNGFPGTASFYLWQVNGLTLTGNYLFKRGIGSFANHFLTVPVNVQLAGNQSYVFFLAVPNGGFTEFQFANPADFMPGFAVSCPAVQGSTCSPAGLTAGTDISGFALTYGPPVPPQVVTPEPASLVLMVTGLAGMLLLGRRRRARQS